VLGEAVYGPVGDLAVHGIAHGEWYRLFTAMFLHYGVLHLLMNMYALWFLGRDIERAHGPLRFVGLYLLAGLGGNVAAYLFSAPNAMTAGASTAVFGLMSAIFVLLKRLNLSIAPILPVIVINVIFTFVASKLSVLEWAPAPPTCCVAASAKSSVAFDRLVTVKVVTAASWPGETDVVALPTSATVTLTLRSTVKVSEAETAVWATPPTWKLTWTVLVMVLPAAVPAA